jgi:hypothetical protein
MPSYRAPALQNKNHPQASFWKIFKQENLSRNQLNKKSQQAFFEVRFAKSKTQNYIHWILAFARMTAEVRVS